MFIVFEGIDGCGKTTVIENLLAHLHGCDIDAISTSEFGNSFSWAKELREELIANKSDPIEQYRTVLKARDKHFNHVLRPALKSGKVVLMDRYVMSTMAYQGRSPFTPAAMIWEEHVEVYGWPRPDLTIWLKCELGTAAERLSTRGKPDAFDAATEEFFSSVSGAYQKFALTLGERQPGKIVVIDAEQSLDGVLHDVVNAVSGLIMTEVA